MKQQDDRSRRSFIKGSSMLGLAAAFSPAAIGKAFADSKSNTTPDEETMSESSATQRASEQAGDKAAIRPFHVNVSRNGHYRITQTRLRDKVA